MRRLTELSLLRLSLRKTNATSFTKRGINFSRGGEGWRESIGDRCTKLYYPLPYSARVPRDKWREKSKREISRDEERRNEVVGCSARILAAVFYFVDREGGGGGRLYTPVVKSYLHLGGGLINYRLYIGRSMSLEIVPV